MKKNKKQSIKRLLLAAMAFIMVMIVDAVPVKPGLTRTLKLENGQTVRATLVGDEFGRYWLGDDGKTYQANLSGDTFHAIDAQEVKSKAAQRRADRDNNNAKRKAQKRVGEFGDYTGEKKALIILVNFKDTKFKTANDKALFERIANEENLSYGNFHGSMYDYFYKQSEGKFKLTFDVAGPVTVSRNASYYGQNDWYGNDQHAEDMVIEAIQLADEEVNYADYDWDGDGYVDQVYLVYAGKGEADGGDNSTIWPHQSDLELLAQYGYGNGAIEADGVKVSKYACGGELNGQTGAINGIGTMCHEFSHCLGYPDFYDIDYSGGQGMDAWDLMSGGSYNGDGYCPAGYTSYERWMAGWLEPIELVYSREVENMKSLQEGGEAYIIYNEGHRDEYYMFENRKKVDWDSYLPGEGLLIVYVDYDAEVWANNQPNDVVSRQRMTWIPADGKYEKTGYGSYTMLTEEGMATDPYPAKGNDKFNRSSNPAAKFYYTNTDGTKFMSSSVENITRNSDRSISFSFKGLEATPPPAIEPKSGIYNAPVEVSMTAEGEDAEIYYTLDGSDPTAQSTKYSAPFTVSQTTTVKAKAIAGDKESSIVKARYIFNKPATEVKTFKRVASLSELESDKQYIIANADKDVAAGAVVNKSMSANAITRYNDIIIKTDDVELYTIDADNGSYAMYNKDGKFVTATAARTLVYTDDMKNILLADDASGVIIGFSSYGTLFYSTSAKNFSNYVNNTTSTLKRAVLYKEYPMDEKLTPTISFSKDEMTATLTDKFTTPTLTLEPQNLAVVFTSSNENVAQVNETNGKLTLTGNGTTTITAAFAGDEVYNPAQASYTLNVVEPDALREVVVGESGYTTLYYSNDALQVPEGIVARTYKLESNSRLQLSTTYNATDVIPAGEPVVIEALQGTYQFAVSMTEIAPDADNALSGTDEEATFNEAGKKYYVLMLPEGSDATHVGFYPQTEDASSIIIGAHQAYLKMDSADGAAFYLLNGDVSGIIAVDNEVQNSANKVAYTLDGRRINPANMAKGVYIVNGKKIVK